MQNILLPFITGLTTGGISCFAVQGSLLTSAIATEKEMNISRKMRVKALVFFLLAKLVAYTLLGFLLGFIGGKLVIIPKVQGWLQIMIGFYMLILAANFLDLHPFFKRFVIRPPKFIFKIVRNQSKVKSFFTPILLGALTVLIPCGVTQVMMLLAVSAGHPLVSSAILFFFILGTIPEFFLIGFAATELFKRKAFVAIAATVIALIGIYSINSGQVVRGSVHTAQNYWEAAFGNSETGGNMAKAIDGYQEATIVVTGRGYQSDTKTLKAGVPVRLKLVTNSVLSCSRAFTIPDYNISKVLPETGTQIIEFTPVKTGRLTYTCSMGMYSGSFNVVE